MKRRPVVEIRRAGSPYKRNPEQILICAEDGAEFSAAARAERQARDHDRDELNALYLRYARIHGWAEARGWAAAQAHYDPTARDEAPRKGRAA